MQTFWIEVYSPAFPNKKVRYRVWDEYPGEELSPSLIHLYEVKAVDKEEAIARMLSGEGRTLVGKQLKLV